MKNNNSGTQIIIPYSNDFLKLPLSSQALYFHLSMRANADGFINDVEQIQQEIGCTDNDLITLVKNHFVIALGIGAIIIRYCRLRDYVQKVNSENDFILPVNKKKTEKKVKKEIPKIPDEISEEWAAFAEMRKRTKKPLTDRAIIMALNKLKELAGNNYELQRQILNQSTFNCWSGLFPLKQQTGTGFNTSKQSLTDFNVGVEFV